MVQFLYSQPYMQIPTTLLTVLFVLLCQIHTSLFDGSPAQVIDEF